MGEDGKEMLRIVVFIDDLDRCLPEKAVELLEAIKLFLDIPGYLFVLGVDKEVVKKGIAYRYRHFEHKEAKQEAGLIISPEDYLEKMIQLPLELPTVEHGRKEQYIQTLLGETEGFVEHTDIIEAGIGEGANTLNPRTLKRFVNLLAFTVRLAETVKKDILARKAKTKEDDENKKRLETYFVPILYIKWAIIVFRYSDEHNRIKGNWRRIIELQEAAIAQKPEKSAPEEKEVKKAQLSARLKKVLAKGITFPENEWLIDRFIHLTESTLISKREKVAASDFQQTYKPGEMVRIPAGLFLYGDEKVEEKIEKPFEIDVYPVTNMQYRRFIDSDGYLNEVYWSDEGRQWKEKNEITQPRYWDDKGRNKPEFPVVGVSYYEAKAYAKWAGKRLPTEMEWEKAARGTDGRAYPWGDDFDEKKCNTFESGVKNTSRVGHYPKGIGPYGCCDMAGNVWEWTDSWYDRDRNIKVSRGGSYDYERDSARCTTRDAVSPGDQTYDLGFRCVRTLE